MKRILISCIIAALGFPLFTQQHSLTIESNEHEGILSRAYSFQSYNLNAWTLQNSFIAKWTQDSSQLEQYYLRNYARDRLTLIRTGEHLRLALHAGGEMYYGDNVPTHMSGWPGRWDIAHGMFGGVDATARMGAAQLDLRTDWWAQWFEPVGTTSEATGDDEMDTNLWSEGRFAWRFNDWIKPYTRVVAFNDLNQLDSYDQLTLAVGNEVSRKLNYIHILHGSAEAAWSNTFDDQPYSARLDARLTSQFGMSWMLTNRLSATQAFISDDGADSGSFTGFYETLAQRVLSIEGNHLSRVQFGGRAWFGDESGYLKANLLYWYKRCNIYLDAEKHFEGHRNHRLTAQLGIELWKTRLHLSYAFLLDDRVNVDDTSSHLLSLELLLP